MPDEVLELAHITHLLAVTPNEAYNTLVCRHFGPELGYHNVHELVWPSANGNDAKRPAPTLRGSPLFDNTLHFDELERRVNDGWSFTTTPLTDTFDIVDAMAAKPGDMQLVAALDGEGGVHFFPWHERIEDPAIRSVICLVPPAEVDIADCSARQVAEGRAECHNRQ